MTVSQISMQEVCPVQEDQLKMQNTGKASRGVMGKFLAPKHLSTTGFVKGS